MESGKLEFVTPIDPTTGKHIPANGLHKVFISYKRNDRVAKLLLYIMIGKIRELNCGVWFDKNLTAGEGYIGEIKDAITDSDAMILLLTNDVLASDFIWDIEVAAANEQEKPIIPIAYGFPKNRFCKVEQKIGRDIHILTFQPEIDGETGTFGEAFKRSMTGYVTNVSFDEQARRFFASHKDDLSPADLTLSELFIRGYGFLHGLGPEDKTEQGTKDLIFVLSIPGKDEKTLGLKYFAADELARYYKKIGDNGNAGKYKTKAERFGSAHNTESCCDKDREIGDDRNAGKYETNAERFDSAHNTELYRDEEKTDKVKQINKEEYITGDGAPKDRNGDPAIAETQRGPYLLYALGNMFYSGDGVEQDKPEAARLYERAEKLGNIRAMVRLAVMYDEGDGIATDKARALQLLTKAADLGDAEAKSLLRSKVFQLRRRRTGQAGDCLAARRSGTARKYSGNGQTGRHV